MHAKTQTDSRLFGLFEITEHGTVCYYQPAADENDDGAREEIVGRNFFNEVAPSAWTNELRERIRHFRRSGRPTESFDLDPGPAEGDLKVRVLLTTIQERTANVTTESVLIHIRRA